MGKNTCRKGFGAYIYHDTKKKSVLFLITIWDNENACGFTVIVYGLDNL